MAQAEVNAAGNANLQLYSLSLDGFKNHQRFQVDFQSKIVAFTGPNGSGKTNLLDALHYLALLRSYFPISDSQAVNFNAGYFSIYTKAKRGIEDINYRLSYARDDRKKFWKNDVLTESLSSHIGQIPLVMISPGDISLVLEGNEIRRRLVNQVLSQIDPLYLKCLQHFNRLMESKNKVLHTARLNGWVDHTLLDILDAQLEPQVSYISRQRIQFFQDLTSVFQRNYRNFAPDYEQAAIDFVPTVKFDHWIESAKAARTDEINTGRAQVGPQRDEISFYLNGQPLRKFGSQGQIKSFIIALKLSTHQLLGEKLRIKPLLLLDDIFEKIDGYRAEALMQSLSANRIGQIFITDTEPDRILSSFKSSAIQPQIVTLPLD